ncbi:response regulator [uncultured Oscillibacter sp.]|uniref:response regulator n=1 Tax=uncultured Oscillibacter sp. TaxID=876091 RepID=UPI0025EF45C2|nr:response regulator [uncultured Oscillibacter sp.]
MKKKVMVVDDSRIVHKKMAEFLEGTDFEIVCFCRSGEEAVERYPEVKPDVVTVDIVMPGAGGMAAARKLRELDPDARLLMVSSLAYDALVDEAVAIGAKGFVFKPFERPQLLSSLEQAVK